MQLVVRQGDNITQLTAANAQNQHVIPDNRFRELINIYWQNDDFRKLLELTPGRKVNHFSVKHYVGFLYLPSGFQINFLPKWPRGFFKGSSQQEINLVFEMLNACIDSSDFLNVRSNAIENSMPIFERFLLQFLEEVNWVIKRGIKSDYKITQTNSHFFKGRLLVSQQIKHNLVQQHKTFIEYDEYTTDRSENRLLKRAIETCLRTSKSLAIQKLAQEILPYFGNLPTSIDIEQDFNRVRLDRSMSYYKGAMRTCKLILKRLQPISWQGKSNHYSFVLSINDLFKQYAMNRVFRLPQQINVDLKRIKPFISKHLTRDKSIQLPARQLKPHVAEHQSGKRSWILAEWQIISVKQRKSYYGLDLNFLYQLKYLTQLPVNEKPLQSVIILCPLNDEFEIPISLQMDQVLDITLVPIQLD
ncbi:5-methylcytosine restriction system specificity protein McrC [Pleionea sediminis]|uniref:5-methylcytosine restriction system specificity protein McrC n=1 Tax=Pleionea sediminis TaxID=2569479 RepID=UPI0013DDF219|nr:hypothetical protein [Pleionea sediminis]